jgi:hypothetical protein
MESSMARVLVLAVAVLLWAVSAAAQTTRTVCASGCDFSNFQSAIDASVCGDTITLAAGETFTGNFQLTNTAVCGTRITIRSNTADGNLPAVGVRAGTGRTITVDGVNYTMPDHRPFMPNIQASAGGLPAIRAAVGARDYTLLGLEVLPNPQGFNVLVELGVNTVAQRLVSEQPRNITVDRCILSGDDIFGQKVGIDFNGANLAITNSWVEKMAGLGQDAIAIRGINGSGPVLIENNFAEGAAENLIIGGDDPWMMTSADPAAGATTTTATLSGFADRAGTAFGSIATLKVGQRIAFLAETGTTRHHTYVRNCGTTTPGATCSSNTITYDAIPSAPDTGVNGDVRWGEIMTGVTVRRNLIYKPLSWKNPIIGAVGTVTATPFTTGGTLAAGTYYYRVTPLNDESYNGNNAYGTTSVEVSAVTTGTTGRVSLSWPAVANATHYRVFRGTAAGTYTGYLLVTGAITLSDTGTGLTAGTIPSVSRWVEKTLFELKFSRDVLVEDNIMENAWGGQGDAYGQCAWIKSNSTNFCEFCETNNVTWRRNICRNVNGYFNFLASNFIGANAAANLENVDVRDSLFQNSSTANGPSVDAVRVNGPVKNLTLDHNTFTKSARGFLYFTSALTTPGFRASNNVIPSGTYGIFGLSCTTGVGCLTKHAPDAVFDGNVLAGTAAATHPALTNLYPSVASFETNFENYGAGVTGNYALTSESAWLLNGTDGVNRGADISAVLSGTNGVIMGAASGAVQPPSITTVGLTPGTAGLAYTATLSAISGTAPYTWSVVSGAVPGGSSLSSAGVLTWASPTVSSTSFTVRVTDSTSGTALTDDQPLTLTINAAPVALNITTTSPLTAGTVPLPYAVQLAATGGTEPYTWAVTSGTLPAGLTLSTTGLLAGVPTAAGVSSFTVTVTDSVSVTDPQAYSLTMAAESPGCSRGTTIIGGITLEGARFVGPVAPTACVRVGDKWDNTAVSPPREHVAITASPAATWTAVSGIVTATHGVLSSMHSDTVTGTLQAGDTLVAIEDAAGAIKLDRMPVGAAGTIATSTGDGLTWTVPVNTTVLGAPASQSVTLYSGSATVNSNVAAGGAELVASGRHRIKVDLENSTQIAITSYMVGACATSPATVLQIEYWDGAAWQPTGATAACSTGHKEGAFSSLAPGARAQDRILRAYYSDGDGAADPSLTLVQIRVR